jgi:3D (Asp-Asp-Asp) domain-containing protein
VFSHKTRWLLPSLCLILILAGFFVFSYLEKEITIECDGKVEQVKTFSNSVIDALAEQNIILYDEDVVIPAEENKLEDGMKIEVKRAVPITIISDNKQFDLRTQPCSVDSILTKANIELNELDKVQPNLDQYIDKPIKITVTRVNQEVIEEIKEIDYEIVSRKDYSMPEGQKKVIQKGVKGQEKIITTHTIEDGEIVAKTSKSEIVKPAKPEIVLVGSMAVASRGGEEFTYIRKLRMLATAYTHTGRLTATGTEPRVGVAAVDPKVIPLGSRLYIDGYGYARAEDTGGAIKGEKIDLFMEDESKVYNFGRRWVTVFVLK